MTQNKNNQEERVMRVIKKWTKKQQEKILLGHDKDELNAARYCDKVGIPRSTFYTWRRKKEKQTELQFQKNQEIKMPIQKGFLKVKTSISKKSESIGIKFPKGYWVEIPEGINEESIAKVLRVVNQI